MTTTRKLIASAVLLALPIFGGACTQIGTACHVSTGTAVTCSK